MLYESVWIDLICSLSYHPAHAIAQSQLPVSYHVMSLNYLKSWWVRLKQCERNLFKLVSSEISLSLTALVQASHPYFILSIDQTV